jgi:uncharacterized protein YegL
LRRTLTVLLALCAGVLTVFATTAGAATPGLTSSFSATDVGTCGGSSTITVTLGAEDPPPGTRPQDVAFVLDESGSIAAGDFARMKTSVQTWAQSQVFGPLNVAAGVVQFSGDARLSIPMTTVKASFTNAVGAIYQRGGSTNITDGLREAQNELNLRGRGSSAQRIYIVQTDGAANVETNALPTVANAIKQSGGVIFAVGVGPAVDQNQLNAIASVIPGVQTIYNVVNYAALTTALSSISQVLNPAATNAAYAATAAPGWEITAASGTGVTHTPTSVNWSAPELHTGATTITYTLRHTGTTGGTLAPQASATLTWTDHLGAAQSTSYAEKTVQVSGCNTPPVANAGGDATAELSGSRAVDVTLDGSGSTDDGRIQPLAYTWTEGGTPLGTGATLTTSLGLGVHTITLTVNDGEYTSTDDVTITVGDPSAPVVTPVLAGTVGTNDWYTTNVAVSWTVTDLESDVTTTGCDPSTVDADTAAASFSCSAESAGGTTTVATPDIKRDATKPTVTYAGNAGTYALNETVAITCTPEDNLSGVASSTCSPISGPAYSFGGGAESFSATATDNAGNVGTGSTSFTVTVTAQGVCLLMEQFVQGSAKYQALRTQQQRGVDRLTDAACRAITVIAPRLDAKQKKVFVGVYKGTLNALVKQGWLTQAQAATLTSLANAI